jgi:ankyrin repeat protein
VITQGGVHTPALQVAVKRGEAQIVKLLLEHAADPNINGEHFSIFFL